MTLKPQLPYLGVIQTKLILPYASKLLLLGLLLSLHPCKTHWLITEAETQEAAALLRHLLHTLGMKTGNFFPGFRSFLSNISNSLLGLVDPIVTCVTACTWPIKSSDSIKFRWKVVGEAVAGLPSSNYTNILFHSEYHEASLIWFCLV